MPHFFLSYARGPDNALIAKFYGDLCVELRERTGERSDDREIGFYDARSISVGQAWPCDLVGALSTCLVMLAMYSPTYFCSESCGKEFQVFWERSEAYRLDTGTDPGALLPIRWMPMPNAKMPRIASEIQNYTEGLGYAYQEYGLRQLMRLKRHEDDYYQFVFKLAEMINEVAEAHCIPEAESVSSFPDISNAFRDHTTFRAEGIVSRRMDINFVVAAPSKEEVRGVRKDLQFYGAQSIDWAPYVPNLPKPIGAYANEIAVEQNFSAELSTVAGLWDQVMLAILNNQVVVLLVDSWATRLDGYQQALDIYEAMSAENTTVMIPWNIQDNETLASAKTLTLRVKETFYRREGRREDPTYRARLLTPFMFRQELADLLEVATNRMIASGQVYRRPFPGNDTRELPILNGP